MTCRDARGLLPLALYGELPPDEAAAVAAHVAGCPACREEQAALAHARAALDAAAPPAVAVDVAALLRADAARQARLARRWRRAALTAVALAAALLLAFALKLEVRAGGGQLVVAWGAPPATVPNPVPSDVKPQPPDPDFEERLRLVQELTRALAADAEARDQRQRDEVVRLRASLDLLQRFVAQRWAETERDVAALYAAYRRPERGVSP